jgi:thioredoxin-dependent peroxiredoxin
MFRRRKPMLLQAGMDAPQFELPDADMEMFSLAGLRGKNNVVLYFYPKDDTPGCTMEANEFTDLEGRFARLDTVVIGVSRDDCLSHAEFRDKYGLSVLLLADTEESVCQDYGVLYDKEKDGRKVRAIQRSTFVIDKQGKLRHALYGVHAHGHPQEILKLLKEMK